MYGLVLRLIPRLQKLPWKDGKESQIIKTEQEQEQLEREQEQEQLEQEQENEEERRRPSSNSSEVRTYSRTEFIVGTVSNLGSALGYLPLRFHLKTGRTSVINRKTHVVVRWFVAFTASLYNLGTVAILLEQFYLRTFSILDIGSSGPLLVLAMSAFCLVFQWNTLWKAKEWAGLWNLMVSFSDGFELRNRETMKKRSPILECLLLATITLVELIGVISTITFVVQCNVTPLNGFLPVCDEVDPSSYRSTAIMIPCIIGLYFLGTGPVITNCIFVAVILLEAVFGTRRTLGEMREQVESGRAELSPESSHQWNVDYRSMQVILTQINACIKDWVVPVFLFTVIVLMVTINYLLITQKVHFSIQALGVTINMTLLLYLFVVVHLSSAFVDESSAVVEMRRSRAEVALDFQTEKFMESCTPFRIWVGALFYFTKQMVPSILQTVTKTTIDVILV